MTDTFASAGLTGTGFSMGGGGGSTGLFTGAGTVLTFGEQPQINNIAARK